MKNKNILITGASGFIGNYLKNYLSNFEYVIFTLDRKINNNKNSIFISNYDYKTDFSGAFKNIDILIHCGGVAHNKNINEKMLNNINVKLTNVLFDECIKQGVSKFIYLSTAKVSPYLNVSVDIKDKYNNLGSADIYTNSKILAENLISERQKKNNISLIIIRPPLVYGPGVKGNLLNLMKFIQNRSFLPFNKTYNLRSMISINNLSYFIKLCIDDKKIINENFSVSDENDYSTDDIISILSLLMNRKLIKFPLPFWVIKFLLKFVKINAINKIFGNFRLNTDKAKAKLNWIPPKNNDKVFKQMVDYFMSNK